MNTSILARRAFLALGIGSLLIGLLLAAWLVIRPAPIDQRELAPKPQVLVAARDLRAGTLLRMEDLRWRPATPAELESGALRHNPTAGDNFVGATVRRTVSQDEPLNLDELVRPGDRAFLATVIGSDTRAVSIALDDAGATAGLLAPGDHVDVVLLQSFTDGAINAAYRAVGETILHNVRVISTGSPADPASPAPAGATTADRLMGTRTAEPQRRRTVTLELTENEAAKLLVAQQLGKAELVLRSARTEPSQSPSEPVWASDVSRALKAVGVGLSKSGNGKQAASTTSDHMQLRVMRGGVTEVLCVDRKTGVTASCRDQTEGLSP